MGDFLELSPDRVLAALEERGFQTSGHYAPLTCLENRVYDVRLEDGRHVIVKFYRPGRWSPDAIAEEHAFLFDLEAAEIPVCAPLRGADGESVHAYEGLWFAVWPRTGGRAPEEFSDDEIALLGRLLARIHNVGAAGKARHRPTLDAQTAVRQPLNLLEDFLPSEVASRFRAASERAAALYEERRAGIPLHRIHGDCHVGNLLRGDQGWFFLDFDDFVNGPAVHDVWMLLPGRDAEGARQRALATRAYRELRDFDDRWLDLVEPLRALRFIGYAAWIARRWHDPAFPSAFPHFGTAEYWARETLDLEDLTGRIASGATSDLDGVARSRRTTPELTNEDLFWDL